MNKKELLQKYYDMEMNIVFENSTDYRMNAPKKGREDEWRDALRRADQLYDLMEG